MRPTPLPLRVALVLATFLAMSFAAPSSASTEDPTLRTAFFWFNSREISDAGHSFYGAYAYQHLLPQVAPKHQPSGAVWMAMLDGDCMTELPGRVAEVFRPSDRALLDRAAEIGPSLCYVIAVISTGARDWAEVDRALRNAKPIGYLGMTQLADHDRQLFQGVCRVMALPVSLRIDNGTLKRISFEFIGDDDLREMGFTPAR